MCGAMVSARTATRGEQVEITRAEIRRHTRMFKLNMNTYSARVQRPFGTWHCPLVNHWGVQGAGYCFKFSVAIYSSTPKLGLNRRRPHVRR